MEEKLKRESRAYLEKLFKKEDDLGSGSISMEAMRKITKDIVPEFEQFEELEEIMGKHLKSTKYTVLNKVTNQFEVKLHDKAIDFPSAQYIIVYFLKKIEKRNSNAFAGKGLIRFDDFPRQPETVTHSKDSQKRRMY